MPASAHATQTSIGCKVLLKADRVGLTPGDPGLCHLRFQYVELAVGGDWPDPRMIKALGAQSGHFSQV